MRAGTGRSPEQGQTTQPVNYQATDSVNLRTSSSQLEGALQSPATLHGASAENVAWSTPALNYLTLCMAGFCPDSKPKEKWGVQTPESHHLPPLLPAGRLSPEQKSPNKCYMKIRSKARTKMKLSQDLQKFSPSQKHGAPWQRLSESTFQNPEN